jgi:hypothetical protein
MIQAGFASVHISSQKQCELDDGKVREVMTLSIMPKIEPTKGLFATVSFGRHEIIAGFLFAVQLPK